MSTVKESADPLQDVQAGLNLLGSVEHQFITVRSTGRMTITLCFSPLHTLWAVCASLVSCDGTVPALKRAAR